ncbi:MAG: hypothetical protein WBM77_04785 [Maribacter sp.]
MTTKKDDKSSWAIGGMTLVGVGVGLIFVQTAPLITAASILIGIGIGLLITSLISKNKE